MNKRIYHTAKGSVSSIKRAAKSTHKAAKKTGVRVVSARTTKKIVHHGKRVRHHIATRPHNHLMNKSKHYARWHRYKHHQKIHYTVLAVYSLGVIGVSVALLSPAYALSTWSQTDWSGGIGGSTSSQYVSASNMDTTTTTGQSSLTSHEEFSDSGFETDLEGWNAGSLPSDISNLSGWYKAGAITGLNDGDSVGTWNDSSSSGFNLSQGTGSKKPIYKASGINNKPAVRFDGTDDYLTNTSISGYSNAATVFVMQSIKGSQCGGTYELGVNSNVNSGISQLPWCGTTMYSRSSGAGAGDITWAYTVPYTNLLSQVYSGSSTNFKAWDNGVLKGTTSAGANFGTPPNSLVIGALMTNNYFLQTDVAEMIFYKTALSDTNRKQVEAYIQNKYGLSSTYQTITRDTSTYHSGSASAKVVASGQDTNYWTSHATPDTSSYNLSAYVYTTGAAVTSADAGLYYNGSAVSTTYTSVGGGWYKLSASITGSTNNRAYGVQVKSGKTAYIDDFSLIHYAASGTLTSNIFDTSVGSDWGALNYSAAVPAGTTVSVKVRAGNNTDLSDAAAFSSCSATASGADLTGGCTLDNKRYAQYQITMTGDGTATPIFNDISISYSPSDIQAPPTNASDIQMKRSASGADVSSNGWTNGASPYFTWTAGSDEDGGSGIKGYCLYLGHTGSADPVTTKGLLGTSPIDTGGACQFAVSGNSVDFSASGYIGSALSSSDSPYYLNVKAIDNANNVYDDDSTQFQFRFDNTPPTNPSFITAPSSFVSSKNISLTWESSGGSAAGDSNSGLAGLQYKIGSAGTWYGDGHSGSQDITDLLANDGSYTTTDPPDYDNLSEGNNIVYFRSWDAAGNTSAANVTTVIKLNTSSPSTPQNVTATPTANTSNSFAFSWLPPASFTGSASNMTYCYTVNTTPTVNNCTFTPAGTTSLSAGAYATQPGENTFYVVAKDEAGNVNYATAGSTTFTANTSAPGIPLNIDVADISVKSTHNWKLAISWEQPTNTGAGVASYKVLRSGNGTSYSQIASTTGTSYVDSGLSPQAYYYKVKACDSANNCGAESNAAIQTPTGKFTTPAELVSNPSVSVKIRSAEVVWATDRTSDSRIQIGTSPGNYFPAETSTSDQTKNHDVELANLQPGTTYYYKAKWTDEDGNVGLSSELTFKTLPAPNIKDVEVKGTTLSTATIQFVSKGGSKVKVYYGKSEGFGGLQPLNVSISESAYTVELEGLDDGSKYFFKINSIDVEGNEYEGTTLSFTTPARPRISNLRFQPVQGEPTSTQKVTWDTNVPTTSLVRYSTPGEPKKEIVSSATKTAHEIIIKDLKDDSEYSLAAESRDKDGNLAVSDSQTFHTQLDTRPPKISDINIETAIRGSGSDARGQIVVSWKTDEPASSQVAYGQGASGSNYTSTTAEDVTLSTEHVVIVSDLATSQVYHLQPASKDRASNAGKGKDQSAIIGRGSDSIINIILDSLQKIFGL